jgi:pancreatic triacylglycerol lipase
MKNLIFIFSILSVKCFLVLCQTWPYFYLHNSLNIGAGFLATPNSLKNSSVQLDVKNYFVVHGYSSSGNVNWVQNIKDEILAKEKDVNVFIVDWGDGAMNKDYLTAVFNMRITAQRLADFIKNSGIDPLNVHCIGHSLGAHACGFAGKVKKFGRITGMDPAGPLFKGTAYYARLDRTDAEFVDNIHGDSLLGIHDAIGHQDFYPNGGASQPGCFSIGRRANLRKRQDIVGTLSCSHSRIPYLYAESINGLCGFSSKKCTNYNEFNNNQCIDNEGFAQMGHYASINNGLGRFYLTTNKDSPYCKS